jgi:DNA-binding XRE family transcriptional regulator
MTRSFKSLVAEVSKDWDADALELHAQAQRYFEHQAEQQILLGRQLSELREGRHLSQKALEDLSGVGQAEISRIERGLSNPTRDTLTKLAAVFGARLAFVIDDAAPAPHNA